MVAKAQAAKDKGNAAFKAGNYADAVGHYTTAIFTDRTDVTFPLNRAAAYLKLGKNEDAERDCTTVLTLNLSNVKALFRRGQARVALDKYETAQEDFKEALRLEPANDAARQELNKVSEMIHKQQLSQRKTHNVTPGPSKTNTIPVTSPPKRRRIPITIVDPSTSSSPQATLPTSKSNETKNAVTFTPGPSETEILKPVSSRPLKHVTPISPGPSVSVAKTSSSSTLSLPTKPENFKEAKQARESTKQSRVGGGIFRASGQSIIFGEKDNSTTSAVPPTSSSKTDRANSTDVAVTLPNSGNTSSRMTLFEFTKSWQSLDSAVERWQLLCTIPPNNLPSTFQISLEPSLLVSLIRTFLDILDGPQGELRTVLVREYVDGLAKVPRFSTVVLFMSKQEKEVARAVLSRVGYESQAPGWNV